MSKQDHHQPDYSSILSRALSYSVLETFRRFDADISLLNALYDLGYGLIEHGLHGAAATVLEVAFKLAPDAEGIVSELVCAYEAIGLNDKACAVLRESGLSNDIFILSYLLAFNTLMTGDIAESQKLYSGLSALMDHEHPHAQEMVFMQQALGDMLSRAESLSGSPTTPAVNSSATGRRTGVCCFTATARGGSTA